MKNRDKLFASDTEDISVMKKEDRNNYGKGNEIRKYQMLCYS